jgi:hypothetical protein
MMMVYFVVVFVGKKEWKSAYTKVLLSPWKPTVLGCVLFPLVRYNGKISRNKKYRYIQRVQAQASANTIYSI